MLKLRVSEEFQMNPTILLIMLVVLLATSCSPPGQQEEPGQLVHPRYLVSIEGCPSPLVLTVPVEFQPAQAPGAQETRTRILERLHTNPARVARYSDVYLIDWEEPTGFPQLTIASLGSLIQHQGRISTADWSSIKSEFLRLTEDQRAGLLEKSIARLETGSLPDSEVLNAQIEQLYRDSDDSLVMVALGKGETLDGEVDYLSAFRLTYVRQCIAYTTIAVNISAPDAIPMLNRFMTQLKVE